MSTVASADYCDASSRFLNEIRTTASTPDSVHRIWGLNCDPDNINEHLISAEKFEYYVGKVTARGTSVEVDILNLGPALTEEQIHIFGDVILRRLLIRGPEHLLANRHIAISPNKHLESTERAKYPRGKYYQNYGLMTLGQSAMSTANDAQRGGPVLSGVLHHEWGHARHFMMDEPFSQSFMNASGWKITDQSPESVDEFGEPPAEASEAAKRLKYRDYMISSFIEFIADFEAGLFVNPSIFFGLMSEMSPGNYSDAKRILGQVMGEGLGIGDFLCPIDPDDSTYSFQQTPRDNINARLFPQSVTARS